MKAFYILICLVYSMSPTLLGEISLKNTNNPVVKVILKGRYNISYRAGQDSLHYYLVDIKIINNTDSTFKFLTYNCSIGGNFVVDKKEIILCAMNCDGNSRTVITLNPKQEFSLPGILMANRRYEHTPVRIGLIWLKPIPENFMNLASILDSRRKSFREVIWSDEFEISIDGHPYEIR